MPRLLDYLTPVYAFLASIDPSLPRALFVAIVFGLVLLWRKLSPDSWRAYSRLIPVTDDQANNFAAKLRKVWQALPSLLLSAVLGALGTGADFWPTLKLALLGVIPPLVHELGWRYSGKLGDGKPLVPPSRPAPKRDHVVFPQDGDGRPLELRDFVHPAWRSVTVGLLALIVGSLVGLTSCSPAALPPGCTEEDAGKMATECAAMAADCVAKGNSEEACGAICDVRADERAKQCR